MHAAGVKIGYGTDLLGKMHDQQSNEFRIRGQVQPAAEVLRSATVVAAELLGLAGEVGVVAQGAIADLLVVDGRPARGRRRAGRGRRKRSPRWCRAAAPWPWTELG